MIIRSLALDSTSGFALASDDVIQHFDAKRRSRHLISVPRRRRSRAKYGFSHCGLHSASMLMTYTANKFSVITYSIFARIHLICMCFVFSI